ncbi:hypothetical protein BVX99_01130 [bacterium F16]|nr:hypothetical protein BVX99_01130 [bacterium F16]
MRITHTDRIICHRLVEATSIVGRMRGMLKRDFSDFDAMLFRRNNSIHMFFMGMPLDIIFLDAEDQIISIRHSLKPWRMAIDLTASSVIELPAGTVARTGLTPGAALDMTVDRIL